MKKHILILSALILSLCLTSCNSSIQEKAPAQFQLLRKDATGLDFQNVLTQSTEFNVFNYMYFFNGGGVSAADFNQDGWVDLYFTSNMGSNKLFLNEGGLSFRDVTDMAGLAGQEGWTTGTSVVDINNDGLFDIYVSQLGNYEAMKGTNQLYICEKIENGVPVFRDQAEAYGLALSGFATQACFFDYDLDGDLDMFQLNHTLHQQGTFGRRKSFEREQHQLAGDRLLRNDGREVSQDSEKPIFTDITGDAGIYSTAIGYGLGVVAGDINLDGWPDLYIANDFHENDYLYINQQDGTFKEVLTEQLMHTSRFSMGVDMADINNDGLTDIFSLDMLPYDPYILKTSLGEDGFDIYQFKIGHGYNHQFARNNLQLNNGNGTFSEIAMYADIYATDWSWAALFLDMDHDGWRDLFISNGIPRRMNDIDYVNFRLGDADIKWKTDNNQLKQEELDIVEQMPQIKIPNKFFRNKHDMTFSDWEANIKDNVPSYSNGAVYADLDNDGDLDIVVNNIDDEPFVYQNLIMDRKDTVAGSFIDFQFRGPAPNGQAIGAKIILKKGGKYLVYEHFPVRGYLSSMAPGLHIGVGDMSKVDEAIVVWPDRTFEKIAQPLFNQTDTLTWKEGLPVFDFSVLQPKSENSIVWEDITEKSGLDFTHVENPFVEFNREVLIPHMTSSEGPALAVADVNGDQLEDVFIGSSKRNRSALFIQQQNQTFVNATPQTIINDSLFEDVDAVFVDIENDGDMDLVIAAGGNEYRGKSEARKQRAYLNDGKGNFSRKDIFPDAFLTASCVLPADINGDGWIDFFIGARTVPSVLPQSAAHSTTERNSDAEKDASDGEFTKKQINGYGEIPTSFLYLNKGDGSFENVTARYSPQLEKAGLVKDGAWADMDGDGDQDLILAVEWEPIQIYVNEGTTFTKKEINELSGWWNFVLPRDMDGDGDMDLLAGNLGENARFKPDEQEPVRMYVNDFDENGKAEQLLTYYVGGKEIPFANHAELTKQMVSLKKKYLYAKDLANASLPEVFGKEKMETASYFEVNFLKSAWFENLSDGSYKTHALPQQLQFSPLEAADELAEIAEHGKTFLLGGNFYDCNIEMGRYDASFGHVFSINATGMQVANLGDVVSKGQIRRIAPIKIGNKDCFVLAKNDSKLQLIGIK